MVATGTAPVSKRWMTGGSMPGGRSRSIAATLSRTSCKAGPDSTSSSNSTITEVTPSRLREVIRLMPLTPWIASSIGSATLLSMVVGSAPG